MFNRFFLIFIILFSTIEVANAQSYIGGSFNLITYTDSDVGDTFNVSGDKVSADSDLGNLSLTLGHSFNRWISLETRIGLGIFGDEFVPNMPFQIDIDKQYGFYSLFYMTDELERLSPYLMLGYTITKAELEFTDTGTSFSKNEKFIQEVLWRVYWKGWLELRPNVWSDYLIELDNFRDEFKNDQNYLNAIEGKTDIDCFNQWIIELKENNYLHNHARMWFASIWIFTLELPWQLGAEFFMKHLYDGDTASNTLGWRWVAGVQTQGKHYLASEWNIKKFTNNRFQNIKLNENAPPKISEKSYPLIKRNFHNPQNLEEKNLLIFENNLSFEITDFKENRFKKMDII